MVQINLLPAAERKKRLRRVEVRIKLRPLIFSLFAVVLAIMLFWIMLGIRRAAQEKQLTRLNEELKSMQSTLQKLDKLSQDKEQLLRKLEFLDQHLKREVLWAQNLNRLSNLVPPGMWLKRVALRTKREDKFYKYDKLDIDGSVASLRGEEMINLIGGFMTALKKDEIFAKQFSEIELISSQRTRGAVEGFELMDFKLVCTFR